MVWRKRSCAYIFLPGDGKALLHTYMDKMEHIQREFELSDYFVEELKVAAYLDSFAQDYYVTRSQGDPRRRLQNLSLSQAMIQCLKDRSHNSSLDQLRAQLKFAG